MVVQRLSAMAPYDEACQSLAGRREGRVVLTVGRGVRVLANEGVMLREP